MLIATKGPLVFKTAWDLYLGTVPTALAIVRSNPIAGIVHNPVLDMVACCTKGWLKILETLAVKDSYIGVTGTQSSLPPAVPFLLPAASSSAGLLAGSMAWGGTHGLLLANAFTTHVFAASMQNLQIQQVIAPGGGPGTGTVNGGFNPDFAGLGPAFAAAVLAEFTKTGRFTVGDLRVAVTPQITALCASLGGIYATVLSSLTAQVAYVGAPVPAAPTTPLTLVNAGKFI